jgi:hypothetical protein
VRAQAVLYELLVYVVWHFSVDGNRVRAWHENSWNTMSTKMIPSAGMKGTVGSGHREERKRVE